MEDLHCWQSKFEPCLYSDKLINQIILLNNKKTKNKVNLTEIKKAIYYAKKYHGGQKRQTGEPYYSHPIEVACQVSEYIFTTDVLVTSILHDTIEDTLLTKDMIACIFSSIIADNVADLTRIRLDQKISVSENIKTLYIEGKNDLLLIKIFDRLHNLQTLSVKSHSQITKTTYETLKEFIILSMYLGKILPNMLPIEEKITKICYQNIPSKFRQTWPYQSLKKLISGDVFQHFSPDIQNDIDQKYIQYLLES